MQSNLRQACSPAQSPGEQGVLCPVFPVFLEAGLTGQGRVPLETCAEAVACLRPPRLGGAGTGRSMSTRRGQPHHFCSLRSRCLASNNAMSQNLATITFITSLQSISASVSEALDQRLFNISQSIDWT